MPPTFLHQIFILNFNFNFRLNFRLNFTLNLNLNITLNFNFDFNFNFFVPVLLILFSQQHITKTTSFFKLIPYYGINNQIMSCFN